MSKERVSGFVDATLAIIITILVLNLKTPAKISLQGFIDIHESLVAYVVSFFWIGTIWALQSLGWSRFEKIDNKVVVGVLFMLFFASLFPYATNIVADHLYDSFAEIFYGLLTLAIMLCNIFITHAINEANGQKIFPILYTFPKKELMIDLTIKMIGLLAAFFWPPAVMLSLSINILFRLIFLLSKRARPDENIAAKTNSDPDLNPHTDKDS